MPAGAEPAGGYGEGGLQQDPEAAAGRIAPPAFFAAGRVPPWGGGGAPQEPGAAAGRIASTAFGAGWHSGPLAAAGLADQADSRDGFGGVDVILDDLLSSP